MKTKNILSVLLFSLALLNIQGQTSHIFNQKPVDIEKWMNENFRKGKTPPFSFMYGEKHSASFLSHWDYKASKTPVSKDDILTATYTWYDKDSGLKVICDVKGYPLYNAIEWVLHFSNSSSKNTPAISQVKVTDIDFISPHSTELRLHYADGTHVSKYDFHPRTKLLHSGDTLSFTPKSGRSSDTAFPFFNIESGNQQGVVMAIGWTGTWTADFTFEKSLSFTSGMKWLNTYLKANECIRTPSACLLFWESENRMDGHNKFRRFLLAHQTHKIDGQPTRYPVSTSFNYGDPAPCNEYTCMTTDYALALINRYKRFHLVPEVFWLDAGWYIKAADVAHNKNWANTVGNWEVDRERFPEGLKPISDAVHKAGAKFMVWFEPERVIKDSDWGINLRKYMLDAQNVDAYLYNLGNPEAREWLCRFIGDLMEENGIDYYRQDFNMNIDNYWRENDEPGRTGITEIRHIEGLYAFWDYLLKRFPQSIIDNCASGGRRIDFETIKRSAPLWRTDYSYGEPIGYQCHTYGLNYFLPLSGTGVDKNDRFTFRSSLGTSVIYNWKITDGKASFTEMQQCQKEFNEVRPYFYEDYYPLTTTEDMTKDNLWMAYQLHRPSDNSGFIVAFRREQAENDRTTVSLEKIVTSRTYLIKNYDTGNVLRITGEKLASEGLTLFLDKPRSSLLLKYTME